MAKTYFSLTVEVPEGESEWIQSLLHDEGAMGLEVRDSEYPVMPGVTPPLPGEATLIACFAERGEAEAAREAVQAALSTARLSLEEKEDQDWSSQWKSLIRSVTVGRLWVGPPWETPAAGKVAVVVEPKMAFGTGDHPTTSLCLAAVDEYLASKPGATVLDVGTGTGVLAIAARKLGAGRTLGVDNDEMSVTLARECAQENGVPEIELSGKTLDEMDGTFDLVLANILANTLVELAPKLAQKTGDRLVLAGVLKPQEAEVEQAFVAQGLLKRPSHTQGEWVSLQFEKKR